LKEKEKEKERKGWKLGSWMRMMRMGLVLAATLWLFVWFERDMEQMIVIEIVTVLGEHSTQSISFSSRLSSLVK
jgi:hypothetical protein